jgi:hypothetical protein
MPPRSHFPGFALRPEIPNEFEELAQGSGLLVARAEAQSADPARPLPLRPLRDGAVALSLERLAFDTDDLPIEMMTAYFNLRDEFCNLEMR